MADITISARVRSNLLALQQTSDLMTLTQGRLATGKKVNSALDNPSSFFQAQGLSDRATQLTGVLDGLSNGISTIQAASKGLDTVYKTLQSLSGLVDKVKADAAGAKNALTGTVTTLVGTDVAGFANSDTLTFTNDTTGAVTTIDLGAAGATKTVSDVIGQINSQTGGQYSASLQNGALVLNAAPTVGSTFTVSSSGAAALTALIGATVQSTQSGGLTQSQLNSYAQQFNDLRTSIDQTATDSGFNGTNLLAGGNDLTVNFNEAGTSFQTVSSKAVSSDGFSVAALSLTASTLADFTGAVTSIKTAQATVRSYQSDFSNSQSIIQNRQDFSKSLISTLKTGSDNLTNADSNEEAANLLSLQTRQQLSQTALSLSNQADQAVLRLFG
jgi:flagellin-like hook-associated protein FlgL